MIAARGALDLLGGLLALHRRGLAATIVGGQMVDTVGFNENSGRWGLG